MKTSAELREEIGTLFDKCEAITAVATEEKRDLEAGEKSDVDAILAQIGLEKGDDGKPTGMWADVKRAERIEKHQQRLAEARLTTLPDDSPQDRPKFKIPRSARALSSKRLKSFVGDGGEYEAYASGQFLLGLFGNESSKRWCHEHGVEIKSAMSTGDNKLGGFLVPDEFDTRVIDLRETYGVFRPNTFVTPMMGDHKNVPRRKSGLTAYAVGDNDEITASDKNWSNVELVAKKWGCLSKYSSELNEDIVISLADDLADEMAYAFARKEDDCGFIGDGTSTYHGITGVTVKVNDGNHAGSISTAATGNTAFSTLDLADFEDCVGKLPEYAAPGAAWYISRVGYWASMARLLDAGGGNTIQDLGRGPERVFLGYPVVISQVLNTTTAADTSAIKLFFGNLSLASTMGNRRGLSVSVSEDRYFELDQIGIKGTTRFAINVHDLGDGSTAGPIVALKTPAS